MIRLAADTKAVLGGFTITFAFVVLPIVTAGAIQNLSEDQKPPPPAMKQYTPPPGYYTAPPAPAFDHEARAYSPCVARHAAINTVMGRPEYEGYRWDCP